jgi:hypothetical protein
MDCIKDVSWIVLKLQRDVKNPGRVDKRDKYDWRKRPVFTKGLEFVVTRQEHRFDTVFRLVGSSHPNLYEVPLLCDELLCDEKQQAQQVERSSEGEGLAIIAFAIMQNSLVTEKTVRHWIVAASTYPSFLAEIVQLLVNDGRLSLNELDALRVRVEETEE